MSVSNMDSKKSARLVKVMLTKVGERLTPSRIHVLNSAVNYLEVGRWLGANGFAGFPRFSSRSQLFCAVASRVQFEKILYLEFGVHKGASLRYWASLLSNPSASLHGFDSFEGLPEMWDSTRGKGTFGLQGKVPKIEDPRVVWHVGWFEKTLPNFVLPKHERLLIHLDADLYSSTKIVLETLHSRIVPGSIIMFDEFCDRLHELRAFSEFLASTVLKFRVCGATSTLEQVVFECVE